jgi:hypothetical protein
MHNVDILTKTLTEIEKDLSLPAGFLVGLYREDDWSFVIKTHAVIEAQVSASLTRALSDDRLSAIFERLELSDTDTGKLAFAKALGLLTDPQRVFVRKLSELRNQLVHNIRNVQFDFHHHVQHELDRNQRQSFVAAVTYFVDPSDARACDHWREQARTDPKVAVMAAMLQLLGDTHFAQKLAKLRGEIAAIDEKQRLLDDLAGDDGGAA